MRIIEAKDFLKSTDWATSSFDPIPGDASFRHYARLKDVRQNRCAILMDAPPDKENFSQFLAVRAHLEQSGFSVPALYFEDTRQGFALLEDLGNTSYSRLLRHAPEREGELYQRAVEVLLGFQELGIDGKSMLPEYDTALLLREVLLFSEWLLPEILPAERLLEAQLTWQALWQSLLAEADLAPQMFVHRDYHADNLFYLPEREGARSVGQLDFQDAVWGRGAYDLVSLLEDARRDVNAQTVEQCLAFYAAEAGCKPVDLQREYAFYGAQRNAKILGIFVRLLRRDGKAHYLPLLPRVWQHFVNDITHTRLASLRGWCKAYLPPRMSDVIRTLATQTGRAA